MDPHMQKEEETEADLGWPVEANPLAWKSVVGFRNLGDKGCDIIPELIGVC